VVICVCGAARPCAAVERGAVIRLTFRRRRVTLAGSKRTADRSSQTTFARDPIHDLCFPSHFFALNRHIFIHSASYNRHRSPSLKAGANPPLPTLVAHFIPFRSLLQIGSSQSHLTPAPPPHDNPDGIIIPLHVVRSPRPGTSCYLCGHSQLVPNVVPQTCSFVSIATAPTRQSFVPDSIILGPPHSERSRRSR
jgi:hypothetical protein